jgi:hypothetical protein
MLIENPKTNPPDVNALLTLMCFHSSKQNPGVDWQGHVPLESGGARQQAFEVSSRSKYRLVEHTTGLKSKMGDNINVIQQPAYARILSYRSGERVG